MDVTNFMKYSDEVIHYFFNAKQAGSYGLAEENILTTKVGNTAIGTIQLQIKLDAKKNIADTRFLAHGCPATVACAAWLTENILHKPVHEIEYVTSVKIASALNLSTEKMRCALLAEDALHELVKIVRQRKDYVGNS